MSGHELSIVVNLLGYLSGASLYAMLFVMAVPRGRRRRGRAHALPLATAVLGLVWNIAGMATDGLRDLGVVAELLPLQAAAFAALGFLPAVVIHAALRSGKPLGGRPIARTIASVGYALGAVAATMQIEAALRGAPVPAPAALDLLTFGFAAALVGLLIHTGRPIRGRQALWVVALAVFAVTALHWNHHGGGESWYVALVGHHASLPLVLAILYQDYRFALADIFLKRALGLLSLVVVALALYLTLGAAVLDLHGREGHSDSRAAVVLLGLWIATALLYPVLRRVSGWFVDVVVLRRADYGELRREIARRVSAHDLPEAILEDVCTLLAPALSAREVVWQVEGTPLLGLADQCGLADAPGRTPRSWDALAGATAVIEIPTVDPPRFLLLIGELTHGRRLLSDDLAMLDGAAVMVARRIDVVRVAHERCQREAREQELQALAVQAELRELRAQLDPHFLFNALTTVAYLVQSAPDRGLDALMQLTTLLRAVLDRTAGEFMTLGEEVDLVESYLAIECARFEDRLRVTIDVPAALRHLRLPPLVIQPLVENALKHGIARARRGGEVVVRVSMDDRDLRIVVRDTGAGASSSDIARGRDNGLGLGNISRRLAAHYGSRGRLDIVSTPGRGTTVEVRLPAGVERAEEMIA